MVVLEVYKTSVKVKYKSTLLSKATLLYLLTGCFSIIIPYILAYQTGDFWVKWTVLYEQPKIQMRGEFFIVLMTNDSSFPIICSTYSFHQQNLRHLDTCALFMLREADDDYDGKFESLSFSIRINLHSYKAVSLHVILPINYTLTKDCPLRMQSAIIYQHYFHDTAVTDFHLMADLEFYQSSAVICHRDYFVNDYFDYPIIKDSQESNDMLPETIMERYLERNFTTHLKNVYTNIKSGQKKDVFNLKLSVRYPEHRIYYQPGFWQTVKMAWVQYLAILVIISWLIRRFKTYIFDNRLVLFYEDSPFKTNTFFSR